MRIVPMLAFLVACGGGGGAADDDQLSDASAAPDAPSPLVPIQVRVNRVFEPDPDPTATVWFSAPDGTVISEGTVNASGVLDGMGLPGGNVTIRRDVPFNGNYWSTVVGIEAGDVVRFGLHLGTLQGELSFRLPASPNETYFVESTCSPEARVDTVANQAVTITARLFDCPATTTFTLTAYGFDGAPSYTIVATDVAVAPGTTVDVAGPWVPYGPRTVELANLAGALTSAYANDIIGDRPTMVGNQATLNGSTLSWTGAELDGVLVSVRSSGFVHEQGFAHGAALTTVDATPRVPAVGGVVTEAGALRWTLSGTGSSDLVQLDGFMAAARWYVVMPPGTTSFTVPQIPGFLQLNPSVSVIDADSTPSYAQIRAWYLGSRERGLFGATLPTTFSVQARATP